MTSRIQTGGLRVARVLYDFINDEALPGTGVDAASFWPALEAIIDDFAPRNRALLARRDELQARIDAANAHQALSWKYQRTEWKNTGAAKHSGATRSSRPTAPVIDARLPQ